MRRAYIAIVVCIALIAIAFIFINQSSFLTGLSIRLDQPLVEGEKLQGRAILELDQTIPLDSEVVFTLNGFFQSTSLQSVIDTTYRETYVQPDQLFSPTVFVTLRLIDKDSASAEGMGITGVGTDIDRGGSSGSKGQDSSRPGSTGSGPGTGATANPGGSGGVSTGFAVIGSSFEGSRTLEVRVRYGEPVFVPSSNELYEILSISSFGSPLSSSYVSIEPSDGGYTVASSYFELVEGIIPEAPPLSVDFSSFGFNTPFFGTLHIGVYYKGERVAESSAQFYAQSSSEIDMQKRFYEFDSASLKNGMPEELLALGCTSYICDDSQCESPSLKDITDQGSLSLLRRQSCIADCGIHFSLKQTCEAEPVAVEVRSDLQSDESGEVRVVVSERSSDSPVAVLTYENEDGTPSLDIVFSKQSIDEDSCSNGVKDGSEESVDCGGVCIQCSRELFPIVVNILWGLVALLAVLFALSMRGVFEK